MKLEDEIKFLEQSFLIEDFNEILKVNYTIEENDFSYLESLIKDYVKNSRDLRVNNLINELTNEEQTIKIV